jgi:hypothetical protein
VLELEATDISYGAVSDADDVAPAPADAKVVDLSPKDSAAGTDAHSHAAGTPAEAPATVDEVAKQVDFALAAPDKLAGLPRQGVHLIDLDKTKGALVTYGKGLGAIVVFQHKVDATKADQKPSGGRDNPLPQINIDGATGTEIATALGTVVTFERGGVAYVVAGSVPPLAAENAARGLR